MYARAFFSAFLLALTFASPSGAQTADTRSFMHPFGFWSSCGYVRQRQVYPDFRYAPRAAQADLVSEGGWVLHERNW